MHWVTRLYTLGHICVGEHLKIPRPADVLQSYHGPFFTRLQIYFFDESHIDELTGRRQRGRWRRNTPLVIPTDFQGTRTRTTLMGLFSLKGFELAGCQVLEGTMNMNRYVDYVVDVLVPLLHPYEGENSPLGSVLVIDNARNHWSAEAIAAIESTGCALIFLPPYSPDYNPIEMGFNLLKRRMQRFRAEGSAPMLTEIFRALSSCCDRAQARGCFRKSGLSCTTKEEETTLEMVTLCMCMQARINAVVMITAHHAFADS